MQYDYYWRIETGSEYHCDLDFDPFEKLATEGKKFAFVMAMYEQKGSIKTLWNNVQHYINQPQVTLSFNNSMPFISDDHGANYNLCHFWSNFELASLDFFRSKEYQNYFDYIDSTGGFWYERWGDAPIHSIAVALFLNKNQIWFANEIGYSHTDTTRCPQEPHLLKKCSCWREDSFDLDQNFSCFPRWNTFVNS